MARLETNDSIHRFQGRWIDNRGTEMFPTARYSAWVIFGVSMPFTLGVSRMLGFSFLFAVAVAVLASCGIAKFCADRLNGEYTVLAWLGVWRSEYRAARTRSVQKATPRPRRAYRR